MGAAADRRSAAACRPVHIELRALERDGLATDGNGAAGLVCRCCAHGRCDRDGAALATVEDDSAAVAPR